MLGLLPGPFGAHNFYAGRYRQGAIRAGASLLGLLRLAPLVGLRVIGLVWVWFLLDVCSVERNGYGREMYR